MTDPMHSQLLGHLLGALDDEEQAWVEERLEKDETYRREWVGWRRRLAPLWAARPEFDPPPGLTERTCRLVAACAPMIAPAAPRPARMSPDPSVPGRAPGASRLDVAVAVVILLAVAAMIPPALHASRFHSRLACCQEKLRQAGMALAQYGHQHHSALGKLASSERLTEAGTAAVGLLGADLSRGGETAIFPAAWLASRGAWRRPCGVAVSGRDAAISTVSPELSPLLSRQSPWNAIASSFEDCSGARRDGTLASPAMTSPAAAAILADAPSAAAPGQDGFACHEGRGRNLFFADGHVDFCPCAAPRGDVSDDSGVSAPVIFVGQRF